MGDEPGPRGLLCDSQSDTVTRKATHPPIRNRHWGVRYAPVWSGSDQDFVVRTNAAPGGAT